MSLTTVDGSLISSGAITLTTQVTGTLPVANGGTGVTTSTGSGANVLGTSPTLTTPTFDSASLATISGTAPLYMCRAWVNFNGTGTVAIRASGNVSSITDVGAGDYTVNFTTAMPDTNFIAVSSCDGVRDTFNTAYPTTSSAAKVGLYQGPVSGSGAVDRSIVEVAIFR